MIGYMIDNGAREFYCCDSGWTKDIIRALRFAREEDAKAFNDKFLSGLGWIIPVMMAPQLPDELLEIRDAFAEAQRAQWHAENTGGDWFVRRRLRRRASLAMKQAQVLCYELFRRSLLRAPESLAKVALPAKAQG